MRRSRVLFVALGVLIAAPIWAISLSSGSDFEDGTVQDWTGDNPTNVPDGGPTGSGDNYLRIIADGMPGPGGRAAAFNPSDTWIGDYATAGVTAINLDVKVFIGAALDMRVVLFGPGGDRWTSTSSFGVAADGAWHTIGFSLAEVDMSSVGAAGPYSATIGGVTQLLIRHQTGAPSSGGTLYIGTVGFDNISADSMVGPIFADGFESGNTSMWSSTVP